jgi:hypothetical protein
MASGSISGTYEAGDIGRGRDAETSRFLPEAIGVYSKYRESIIKKYPLR